STRGRATTDVYSYPFVPAMSASTGPALAPCTTLTGRRVPASPPAGTSIQPDCFSPRRAVTPPTVSVSCAAAAAGTAAHSSARRALIVILLLRSLRPFRASRGGAGGT